VQRWNVQGVDVTVRRSSRARRPHATFRPDRGAELVVPAGMGERAIRRQLKAHASWIVRRAAAAPAPTLGLERRTLGADEGRVAALERIVPIVEEEAERLGVTVSRIAVRDQRMRWGSCSRTGSLSFNWRLVLAPHDVLDYVVVHELCHLREPNHSAHFWAHVELARPRFRAPRAWLARHGWELLAFEPAR
jgi:predicted metal-dependent hydrolase